MRSHLVPNGSIRAIRLKGDRLMTAICGSLWLITLGFCPLYATWLTWAICATFCFAVPLLLNWLIPGTRGSRIGIGLCMMGFAALTVYQTHGLVEAHFGFFILLALLLYYRDWRPIFFSSLVVVAHHLLFCWLQMNGYAVYLFSANYSMNMVFVHAVYVACEASTLIFLTLMFRLEALESSAIAAFGERITSSGTLNLTFDSQRHHGPAARGLTNLLNAVLGVSRQTGTLAARIAAISENTVLASSRMVRIAEEKIRDTAHFRECVQSMSDSANQIKFDCAAVAQVASQSATIVSEGSEIMQHAAALMHTVSQTASSTVDEIALLQADSSRIESIVEIMNDMANQSALLALNASIEAARAGEKGRGFHVLAQEIRTLSERSYQSLNEVQTVVETIRLRIAQLQAHAVRSQSALTLGETQVTAAHRALTEVSQHLPGVADRVSRVVYTADQQAALSASVTAGMTLIGEAMQTIADEVRGVSTLSHSLEEISEELSANVSQFQHDSRPLHPVLA